MTVGAFCIIRNESGQILLCHRRDRDMWNLPGGRAEDVETPWEAAAREVVEEIKTPVEIGPLRGVYYKSAQDDLVFFFEAKQKKPLKLANCVSEEVDVSRFFPANQLPYNTAPRQKRRLEHLFIRGTAKTELVIEE